jgi:hypothetical protein
MGEEIRDHLAASIKITESFTCISKVRVFGTPFGEREAFR